MRFCMGAENAKMKSAEKSAETGGHQKNNTTWYVFTVSRQRDSVSNNLRFSTTSWLNRLW